MEKFCDVLSRWKVRELSAQWAREILGCSERQFRPIDKVTWMLSEYRTHYRGWTVKHFFDHLQKQQNFRWSYTWVKTQLPAARLVVSAARSGAYRRKRPRKPCIGMMLHQDGSRYEWLEGRPELDLIATLDDATSELYSAFFWWKKNFRTLALPKSANRQRATTQTPQWFDATHGNEVFPVNEQAKLARCKLCMRCFPPSRWEPVCRPVAAPILPISSAKTRTQGPTLAAHPRPTYFHLGLYLVEDLTQCLSIRCIAGNSTRCCSRSL
jgi:hypothetical protein